MGEGAAERVEGSGKGSNGEESTALKKRRTTVSFSDRPKADTRTEAWQYALVLITIFLPLRFLHRLHHRRRPRVLPLTRLASPPTLIFLRAVGIKNIAFRPNPSSPTNPTRSTVSSLPVLILLMPISFAIRQVEGLETFSVSMHPSVFTCEYRGAG